MTLNKSELVAVRDGVESDRSFIFATFLRGLFYGDSVFSEVPKSIFMTNYHKVIEHILNSPSTAVKVACLREDPEVILGYVILKPDSNAIVWAFCKKAWRGIGLIKSLIPDNITTITHATKSGISISKKKGWIFNPFIT